MQTGVFSRPHPNPSLMAAAVKYRQYWRHDYTLLHLVRLHSSRQHGITPSLLHLISRTSPAITAKSRLVQTPQSADNVPHIIVIVAAGSRQLHIISHIMAVNIGTCYCSQHFPIPAFYIHLFIPLFFICWKTRQATWHSICLSILILHADFGETSLPINHVVSIIYILSARIFKACMEGDLSQ